MRFLERRRGGISLAAVGVTLRLALEHRGEFACVFVAVSDRDVQWFVQRPVLDRRLAIGMQDRSGETRFA